MTNIRLKAALSYAENLGWHVFPLHNIWEKYPGPSHCSCRDPECRKPGKHPRVQWKNGATTDRETIRQWWSKWPFANIGVATGKKSGVWVVDCDVEGDSYGLQILIETYGEHIADYKNYLYQQSPSGGSHIFIEYDETLSPVPTKTRVLKEVDIRGDGGLIVVQPSVGVDGEYEFNDVTLPLHPVTDWARKFVEQSRSKEEPTKRTGQRSSIDVERYFVEGIQHGVRDSTLLSVAGRLRHFNVPSDIAEFVMRRLGEKCVPPDVDMALEKLRFVYTTYSADKNTPTDHSFVKTLKRKKNV